MKTKSKTHSLPIDKQIVGTIPHLHPFALTLLLATPSQLDEIKDDDTKIRKFLIDSGITDTEKQKMYLDVIHVINNDTDFQNLLPQLHAVLLTKLGMFYPTPPCPMLNDSIDIMKRLG